MKEVMGQPNKPYARLRPLGWTAVGKVEELEETDSHYTGFHHTFRLQMEPNRIISAENEYYELNSLLKRFWDLKSIGIVSTNPQMTSENKLAWHKGSKSLKFDGKHYEVAVPWKTDRCCPATRHWRRSS